MEMYKGAAAAAFAAMNLLDYQFNGGSGGGDASRFAYDCSSSTLTQSLAHIFCGLLAKNSTSSRIGGRKPYNITTPT